MEFDKSRVYTALNADELKVGSEVIIADDIRSLYNYVKNGTYIRTLKRILPESYKDRFEIIRSENDDFDDWNLAYLVSEPNALKFEDIKIGDVVSDGSTDFMVLGVDRINNAIFLPHLEWVSDFYLTRFYKKEEQIEKE